MSGRVFLAVLAGLVLVAAASPAFAKIGKDRPLYEGLLAPGVVVQEGPPLAAGDLRGKKVVLIASADFNAYSEWWTKIWKPGGVADKCAMCRLNGGNRDKWLEQQQKSEPGVVGERVMDAFAPYAKEVVAASDFATAREQGGDYFVIVDYWFQINGWSERFNASGGFQVLDRNLSRVFDNTGTATVKIGSFCGSTCQAEWYAQSFNQLFNPGIERLRAQLGPP